MIIHQFSLLFMIEVIIDNEVIQIDPQFATVSGLIADRASSNSAIPLNSTVVTMPIFSMISNYY